MENTQPKNCKKNGTDATSKHRHGAGNRLISDSERRVELGIENMPYIGYCRKPRAYICTDTEIDWHLCVYGGQKANGRQLIGGIAQ